MFLRDLLLIVGVIRISQCDVTLPPLPPLPAQIEKLFIKTTAAPVLNIGHNNESSEFSDESDFLNVTSPSGEINAIYTHHTNLHIDNHHHHHHSPSGSSGTPVSNQDEHHHHMHASLGQDLTNTTRDTENGKVTHSHGGEGSSAPQLSTPNTFKGTDATEMENTQRDTAGNHREHHSKIDDESFRRNGATVHSNKNQFTAMTLLVCLFVMFSSA